MNRGLIAALAVVLIAAGIVGGSWIYWNGEGRPGTPDEFRQRVAATGLVVEWTNTGPRGGDGSANRTCGPLDVSVAEIDGGLWLNWDDRRIELTLQSARAFRACKLS